MRALSAAESELFLLGGFRLVQRGGQVPLAPGSQRLLGFLALQRASVRREHVAGVLWPEASERRAHACLRSALTRLAAMAPRMVRAGATEIALADHVTVDFEGAQALARGLLEPVGNGKPDHLAVTSLPTLSAELLPGWYEDWVLLAAENWRQLRLHALESLASGLRRLGRFGEAVAAAGAAIAADPLRESARAALIRVHLAEGNQSEALREFERYRALLNRDLGIEPTERLRGLLAPA